MTSSSIHPSRTAYRLTLAGALAAISVVPALGQLRSRGALQQADPGVGDVSLLQLSPRLMPMDLRLPSGFDTVYRVPGAPARTPGGAAGPDRFARASGGLIAVFPRSDYVPTRKGVEVLVPADTIFYIGGLPETPAKPVGSPDSTSPTRASTSASQDAAPTVPTQRLDQAVHHAGLVDMRVHPESSHAEDGDAPHLDTPPTPPTPPRKDGPAPTPTMLTDESYRRLRVRELLMGPAGHPGEPNG